ncbi:asparagine synthase-related protein [Methylobacterium sp. NEAU 140]|uniref:asparagine synthetase B family protein n=1 Tax=Methylobacterium sp. NEAU 140 TaxID=3064945 RepID=UPI002732BB2F|nr:asparagine synthase-related protein [Methylobacterium sp. NEAU 140]MDP4026570.1 asparagine synthase-related protein [Methylobacterium sp. NEAU 140]
MCAIVGLFDPAGEDPSELERVALRMQRVHSFRGPDGAGVWANARVALGSVRLAIQGDMKLGLQPLEDRWGGHLVFNGEIYQPRRVLEGLGEAFHPEDSDGVALEAVLALQGPAGLKGLRGMFAAARYDLGSGSLTLVRDTWGQKPLYIARWRNGWAFSSTIAALEVAVGPLRLRRAAPFEYLIYKSVGGCHTSFEGVEQVPPGSWLRIRPDGEVERGRYAELPTELASHGAPGDVKLVLDEAIAARGSDRFVNALFLSGGADSAIVAASLVRQRRELPMRAFSIGYDVPGGEDETGFARRMADHLGLEHEVVRLRADQVPSLFEEAARFTEDPIQDPVTLPTLLLARRVSEVTKVAISGDGSDEFWGGYERFDDPPDTIAAYLPRAMVFHPEELGLDAPPASYLDGVEIAGGDNLSPLDKILRLECANRLRNYHLARVDKLGMASALEIRSPFLDARVTALAHSLHADAKRPNGRPKGLLLDAFAEDLPAWLVNRRKQPFTVPVATWLRGDLRAYVRDTLSDTNAFVRAYVDPRHYLDAFDERGEAGTATRIWSLLQLEAWHRVWKDRLA